MDEASDINPRSPLLKIFFSKTASQWGQDFYNVLLFPVAIIYLSYFWNSSSNFKRNDVTQLCAF